MKFWASQLPFLHSIKDMVLPSVPCPYDHVNWSLAKAKQHSSMGLSQSLPPVRGDKARPKTGFCFTVQRDLCWSLVMPL